MSGLLRRLLVGFICGLVAVSPAWACDDVIDSVNYTDPDIPAARVVKVFSPRLLPLWLRALEQSAILLATLDHKPAAPRLVQLLQFERPEVFVSAAWALRKLAVRETLPDQLRQVDRQWQRLQQPEASDPREMIDFQIAQLAQSLGRAQYQPASSVLRRFVPKLLTLRAEARAGAIWALGLIHQNAPPPDLIQELIGRVTDDSVTIPEDPRIRQMCAVALGRMRAREAVDSLRTYYPKKLSTEPFPNACGWALQQITGEPLPASGTVEVFQRGWFLEANE